MKHHALTALLLTTFAMNAATIYVRTDGNDSNNGLANTAGGAKLTIQAAENLAVAGDTVRVQAGTYNERVTANTDGSVGSFINYIADGTVIMRGWSLSGVDYIRIIGFEITHDAATWSRAVTFSDNCSNVEILRNYIHNTHGDGGAIRAIGLTSTNNYVTVRDNTFYHLGYVDGVFTTGNSMAVQTEEWNQFWLVEYNVIQRAGDFIDMDSWNSIVRNNYIHDYADAHWSSGAGHADVFQPFSISNQVYEANFAGDNIEANSHFLQIRQNDTYGTNLLFRGNVGYNMGSYPAQLSGADRLRLYHNTYYDFGNVSFGTPFGFDDEATGDGSIDGLLRNNIMHTIDAHSSGDMTAGNMVSLCATCAATVDNNLSYNGPTTGGGIVSTSDPLFVNAATKQFWLQAGSPAIGIAVALTTVTTASGSGTSFDVSDAKDFTDGMGLVVGDAITLENGSTRTITGIAGNTITVSASVAWTQGDDVFWRNSNDPALGAYPYGHTPLTAATHTGGTVTPNGDTRCVRQYRDGLEIAVDYASPFSFTHQDGDTYRAFALYASATPVVNAVLMASTWNVGTLNIGTLNVGQ